MRLETSQEPVLGPSRQADAPGGADQHAALQDGPGHAQGRPVQAPQGNKKRINFSSIQRRK